MSDDDRESKNHQYKVSARVMITALTCLFFIVMLVILLHLYARRKLRQQARHLAMNRQLAVGVAAVQALQVPQEQPKAGLDPAVIETLPIFAYQSGGATAGSCECSVCLSGMEEGEIARILPNCKHTFHQECIDMWLHSHSTCPICRAEAQPRTPVAAGKAVAPSAPPLDPENSAFPVVAEGGASGTVGQTAKAGGSSSLRLSSFRRMLSRERSSRRMQACGQEEAMEDLERQ